MSWLLLKSACTAWSLPLCLSSSVPFPVSRLSWAGRWEREQPSEHSMPYNIMLGNKNGWRKKVVGFLASKVAVWRLAGHQSACGRWWTISFASLVFSSSFLHMLNCIYLDPRVFSLLLFLFSLSYHWGWGRGGEWAVVWVLSCCLWSTQHIR